jgi:hypothetical protein
VDVFAFRVIGNRWVESYTGSSVDGNFPALSDLSLLVAVDFYQTPSSGPWADLSIKPAQSQNFQWGFGVSSCSSNTAGNADFLIKKIQILT